jgi:hypothetical protein
MKYAETHFKHNNIATGKSLAQHRALHRQQKAQFRLYLNRLVKTQADSSYMDSR